MAQALVLERAPLLRLDALIGFVIEVRYIEKGYAHFTLHIGTAK